MNSSTKTPITKNITLARFACLCFKQQTNQESPGPSSPRRHGSPRQTGRGSPGARISWLTAAKSGVGGQVMLNDKGKDGREGTVGSVGVQLHWLVLDRKKALQKMNDHPEVTFAVT